jgi:hypothetical protein
MAATTLKLAGREFVILPKSEYATLKSRAGNGSMKRAKRTASKQDAGDLAEIERRRKEVGKNIPWKQVKRELGL